MAESYSNRLKTLWEMEKLLITSNFSFSNSVFKRLVSMGRQKVSLCGNGLNAGKIKISVFERVENIEEKGQNAGKQHFFPFLTIFSCLSKRNHHLTLYQMTSFLTGSN